MSQENQETGLKWVGYRGDRSWGKGREVSGMKRSRVGGRDEKSREEAYMREPICFVFWHPDRQQS